MRRVSTLRLALVGIGAAVAALSALGIVHVHAQSKVPINPPYRIIADWPRVPTNLKLGAVPGIHIGPDGNIYAFHRCGADSCVGSKEPTILKFDSTGRLLTSWGAGMFNFPHGIDVDREGFVWVADAAGLTASERTENGRGHQVFKFSPDGKLLLTLGKAGIGGNGPDTFFSPTDVAVAANGDIFVTDGHSCNARNAANCSSRVVKFSKTGAFIKAFGKTGSQPGEFQGPHCLAIDSRGRIIVGDRGNGRLQVFDADGTFLEQWTGWGKPTGIFIAKDDTMYVTDSLANVVQGKVDPALVPMATGIYVGSAKDGSVKWFIPDEFAGPEDITVDASGDLYVGESRPQTIRKIILDPERLLMGDPELRQKTLSRK
jgi:DNA-binding beta-propeller fold protein YncE